ncbi:MAG: MotA/TolQ/ExbB proton channel family protein [Desulfobacter sp.]
MPASNAGNGRVARLNRPGGFLAVVAVLFLFLTPVRAQDMRQAVKDFEVQQRQMAEKADLELTRARDEARERTMAIRSDRKALENAIAGFRTANAALKKENTGLGKKIDALLADGEKLREELAESRAVNKELAGFVRTYAKDLKSLLNQSLQSALTDADGGDIAGASDRFLDPVIDQKRFWSMDDVEQMGELLFREIEHSGQVKLTTGPIIDRQGRDQTARILTIGNFTGIYVLEAGADPAGETGFLLYSDQSRRFFALSRLPSGRVRDQLENYLSGASDSVPMDMSRGGALRQLTHELNLAEQVPKGGPIVWPILVILGVALLILLERLVFFARRRMRLLPFMQAVKGFVDKEDWQGCETFMAGQGKRLVPKVLLAALPFRDQARQDMENALQEAILGEIPAIERFLSTLGMLAAIAPLMGLLGTVTGMINTFHIITYYGAGDPRMMAGGISEALVTTMLGLAVAIPIMLCHTFLSRKVETQISGMEEKAVAFVNLVFKARNECRPRDI